MMSTSPNNSAPPGEVCCNTRSVEVAVDGDVARIDEYLNDRRLYSLKNVNGLGSVIGETPTPQYVDRLAHLGPGERGGTTAVVSKDTLISLDEIEGVCSVDNCVRSQILDVLSKNRSRKQQGQRYRG